MSSETVAGNELGKGVLQRSLGQGTLGTVYLALHENHQVAIKVFSPPALLEEAERKDFLTRLEKTIKQSASLAHPSILQILDYKRREKLLYQVTPFIAGESLEALLKRSGALPFTQVERYLTQLAEALDYAHTQGILHRDLRPANILLADGEKLLLSDFGLAGLTTEKNFAKARRAVPGMLNTIAPEYVLGKAIDSRADLYSLGAVLYQMVTGEPLFTGTSLNEVAMKHVKTPPPSPRALRSELPLEAEQALLRALAKRPGERYAHASELATAFRLALQTPAPIRLQEVNGRVSTPDATDALYPPVKILSSEAPQTSTSATRGLATNQQANTSTETPPVSQTPTALTAAEPVKARQTHALDLLADLASDTPTDVRKAIPRTYTSAIPRVRTGGLFDPTWRSNTPVPAVAIEAERIGKATVPLSSAEALLVADTKSEAIVSLSPAEVPVHISAGNEATRSPVLSSAFSQTRTGEEATVLLSDAAPVTGALRRTHLAKQQTHTPLPEPTTDEMYQSAGNQSEAIQQLPFAAFAPTATPTGMLGALATLPSSGSGDRTTTIKLDKPLKIVQVPLAGQPGHFVTGFLPVLSTPTEEAVEIKPKRINHYRLIISLILAIVVVVASTGIFLAARSPHRPANTSIHPAGMSASAQATATVNANIIVSDDLSQNTHNWPPCQQGGYSCVFKDGGYHITNHDATKTAFSLLPGKVISQPFAYSLTMEQIKGDETSATNQFGMMLDENLQTVNGKQVATFYAFELLNTTNSQYQFWKYDSSRDGSPWGKAIWTGKPGKEFHQGHGPSHVNTLKMLVDGTHFTFFVNGKQVGNAQDSSLSSGSVGMLVNLDGSEVAFSDFLITHR